MTVHEYIRQHYSAYILALGDRDKVLFDNLTIPEEDYAALDLKVAEAEAELKTAITKVTGLTMAELEKIR